MSKRTKFVAGLTIVAALVIGAVSANAQQITGGFSVQGPFLPTDPNGNLVALNLAHSLDFTQGGNSPTPGAAGIIQVANATGDLAGQLIPFASVGSIRDFT